MQQKEEKVRKEKKVHFCLEFEAPIATDEELKQERLAINDNGKHFYKELPQEDENEISQPSTPEFPVKSTLGQQSFQAKRQEL